MKPTKEPEPARLVRRKVGTRTVLSVAGGEPSSEGTENGHYFQNYAEYSKTLRAWLVAYGIGGPVLFLTNNDFIAALRNSTDRRLIITLFLVGVSAQVFLAFINKWCAWYVYAGEIDHAYRAKLTYKLWAWINGQNSIDLLIDFVSLAAFAYSTWLILSIFV